MGELRLAGRGFGGLRKMGASEWSTLRPQASEGLNLGGQLSGTPRQNSGLSDQGGMTAEKRWWMWISTHSQPEGGAGGKNNKRSEGQRQIYELSNGKATSVRKARLQPCKEKLHRDTSTNLLKGLSGCA